MEMMKILIYNMKKYRKKRRISQMKLAGMLETSTSYIGEIEINSRVPSLAMVEKIANALNIEPFRLFIDDSEPKDDIQQETEDYLECLTTKERKDLTQRIVMSITSEVEQILQPETEK